MNSRSRPRRCGNFLLADKLICPAGDLWFPPVDGGSYSAYHLPFHPDGLHNGNRLDVLTLTGARLTEYVRQPQFDWVLISTQK